MVRFGQADSLGKATVSYLMKWSLMNQNIRSFVKAMILKKHYIEQCLDEGKDTIDKNFWVTLKMLNMFG